MLCQICQISVERIIVFDTAVIPSVYNGHKAIPFRVGLAE